MRVAGVHKVHRVYDGVKGRMANPEVTGPGVYQPVLGAAGHCQPCRPKHRLAGVCPLAVLSRDVVSASWRGLVHMPRATEGVLCVVGRCQF